LSFSSALSSVQPNTQFHTDLGVFLFLKLDGGHVYAKDVNNEYVVITASLWDTINPTELSLPLCVVERVPEASHNEDVTSPPPAVAVLPQTQSSGSTQSASLIQPILPLRPRPPQDDDDDDETKRADNRPSVAASFAAPAKYNSVFEVLKDDPRPQDYGAPAKDNSLFEVLIGAPHPQDDDVEAPVKKTASHALFDNEDEEDEEDDEDYEDLGAADSGPQIERIDDPDTIRELMSLTGWSPQDDSAEAPSSPDNADAPDNSDDGGSFSAASDAPDIDSPIDAGYTDAIDFPEHRIFVYPRPSQKLAVYGGGLERIYRYVGGSFRDFCEGLKCAAPSAVEPMLESWCALVSKTKQDKLNTLRGCLHELKDLTGISGSLNGNRKFVYLSGGRLRARARIAARDLPLYIDRACSGAITSVPSFTWRGPRL
jgi:hypothetical protein